VRYRYIPALDDDEEIFGYLVVAGLVINCGMSFDPESGIITFETPLSSYGLLCPTGMRYLCHIGEYYLGTLTGQIVVVRFTMRQVRNSSSRRYYVEPHDDYTTART